MTNNKNFCYYYHSSKSNDWGIDSYKLLGNINNTNDINSVFENNFHSYNGMFFLFEKNIEPLWEDPNNINGGSWSFKININNSTHIWKELCFRFIDNNILLNNNFYKINGITYTPKKYISIIKIWNNNSEFNDDSYINNDIKNMLCNNAIYRAHKTR